MFARKGARKRATTTPNYDRTTHVSTTGRLARVLILLVVPLLALAIFGQPALRIEYTWQGHRNAPIYTRCVYLGLDGWHDDRPPFGINQCPLVTLLPLDVVAFLTGR